MKHLICMSKVAGGAAIGAIIALLIMAMGCGTDKSAALSADAERMQQMFDAYMDSGETPDCSSMQVEGVRDFCDSSFNLLFEVETAMLGAGNRNPAGAINAPSGREYAAAPIGDTAQSDTAEIARLRGQVNAQRGRAMKAERERDVAQAALDKAITAQAAAESKNAVLTANVERANERRDAAKTNETNAMNAKTAAVNAMNDAKAERDAAVISANRAIKQRDAAKAERDTAQTERDAAKAERDTAQTERDAAKAERDDARAHVERIRKHMTVELDGHAARCWEGYGRGMSPHPCGDLKAEWGTLFTLLNGN